MAFWIAQSIERMNDAEMRRRALETYTRAVNAAHRAMTREIQSQQTDERA